MSYAGRQVEHFFRHPEDLRLLGWTVIGERFERALKLDTVSSTKSRAAAARRAQAARLADQFRDPDELLQHIQAIATYWARATAIGSGQDSRSHPRAVAEEAVRRLIEPRR
jgi:hypothetical protein